MSTSTTTTTSQPIHAEDVLPVRSRVSWGAILAGAAVAIVLYFLLAMFGVAIGLSVAGGMEDREGLGTGAAIWAILSALVAMFAGGCVTSRCTAGETTTEAMMYGTIMWGVVFVFLLWLAVSGIRLGFSAMVGMVNSPVATEAMQRFNTEDLRGMGLTQQQINQLQARFQTMPRDVESYREATAEAAWWTFGGILLTLLAAIGGAVVSAGPALSIRNLGMRFRSVSTTAPR